MYVYIHFVKNMTIKSNSCGAIRKTKLSKKSETRESLICVINHINLNIYYKFCLNEFEVLNILT